MTANNAGNSVNRLIESARRRLHLQILSTQALVALSIGAGGLVLLLILGTQVLDWYWPLLLALLAFGVLAWRVWNKLPDAYRSAQIVDQRLDTHDLFSSAHHFIGQASTERTAQLIAIADESAATIAPATAVPFHMPSGWARAIALSVVALSLLVFRYAFQSSLDLEQPIAPGLFSLLASGEKPKQYAKGQKKDLNAPPLEGFGMTENAQQRADEKGAEKGKELDSQSQNSTDNASNGQKPGQFQQSMSPSEEGEKMQGSEKGEKSAAGDKGEQGKEGDKGEKKEGGAAEKKSGGQPQNNQQGDKNSLMDKFRDAMANMMNKMKSDDKQQGQKQEQGQKGQQDQQQGNGQQQQAQKGQQAQGKQQQGQQQQQADPNGQQQGEGNEKSPNQQAKGGDKSNQPSSGDAKSGMGKQDGAKNIELAEQQKAMGKISEVFGKRAQNLQGEIMIEVSSSKSQSLKTNYSGKSAAHADTSGVIHRDEVPLIFQNYVQRYFEELRKAPVPATPPAK